MDGASGLSYAGNPARDWRAFEPREARARRLAGRSVYESEEFFGFDGPVNCGRVGDCGSTTRARAGETTSGPGYKVLDPIRHGNLTVFPVVAAKSYPTGEFLTLDEGLRSGEVVVTEAGSVQGLVRRHPVTGMRHDGAEVNRLVLVNNSKRPLLLLAGEIVTGGKQDRVIGKDRIVPAESDPDRPERLLRRARALGRQQRAFRRVGSHVRRIWRRQSRPADGDDGATLSSRQSHGR